MRRREFIALLGGATAAWPLAAHAQPTERMRRTGVLMGIAEDHPEAQARLAGFRRGLEKRGWVEGRGRTLIPAVSMDWSACCSPA
jgi:putative ABC transport system substrate-binding protein